MIPQVCTDQTNMCKTMLRRYPWADKCWLISEPRNGGMVGIHIVIRLTQFGAIIEKLRVEMWQNRNPRMDLRMQESVNN